MVTYLKKPDQFGFIFARTVHRGYKFFISPLFGNACRFEPYCSDYALEAIQKHGYLKGSWLSLVRLVRCNPYCKGGYDPVPQAGPCNEEIGKKRGFNFLRPYFFQDRGDALSEQRSESCNEEIGKKRGFNFLRPYFFQDRGDALSEQRRRTVSYIEQRSAARNEEIGKKGGGDGR